MVAAEGRACVICVNKWDAIPDRGGDTMGVYEKDVLAQLHPISWAAVHLHQRLPKVRCLLRQHCPLVAF